MSVKHSIQRAIALFAHNAIKWEFLQAILRNECDGKKVTSMHLWIAVLYGDHKVTVHTPWCCSSHFMWSIKRQHWAQRIAIFNWQTKIENWNKNTTKQKWLRQKMLRLNIATDTKLNIMTKVSRPLRLDHRSNIWASAWPKWNLSPAWPRWNLGLFNDWISGFKPKQMSNCYTTACSTMGNFSIIDGFFAFFSFSVFEFSIIDS